MKGDFSKLDAIISKNLNGVLHQQGRVLLDNDWNDHTRLVGEWQDTAARHVIGGRVAAVPRPVRRRGRSRRPSRGARRQRDPPEPDHRVPGR